MALQAIQKVKKFRLSMKNFLEVWGYLRFVLWQSSKRFTIILFVLSLCGGLTLIAELWAMTTLINNLIEYDLVNNGFQQAIQSLLPWLLIFIGAMLIQHITSSIQPYISKCLEEEAASFLKGESFKKILRLDILSFESKEYYNELENANRAINSQLAITLEALGFFLAGAFELIVIIIAVSKMGILYAALLTIGSFLLLVVKLKSSKEFNRVNYGQSPLKRQVNYWGYVSTSRETAAELRLFGLGPYFLNKWNRISDQLLQEFLDVRKKVAYLNLKAEFVLIILLGIIIIGAVIGGVKGTISIGALVAFLYLLNRFDQAVSQLSGHGGMLAEFHYTFQYVPKFFRSGIEERTTGLPAPEVIKHGITFENVGFTYPGSSKPSLQHIDFHISSGERIALVGENGAGKSTLALLLLGLYEPTEGRILIDGMDMREIDLAGWRRKAAAVFQNFVKYQLSAKENIALGNILFQDDEERWMQSAELSGIANVLSQLPYGYETLLGREYEKSKDLSGGEWQKVAIARAYFRDADILVLDEPTAALDAQSEYEVYKQFSKVSEGKTTLLISHRLGSARLADKIMYLHSGQLMEIGSHEELISKDGRYANMYHLQAEWYEHGKEEKNGEVGSA